MHNGMFSINSHKLCFLLLVIFLLLQNTLKITPVYYICSCLSVTDLGTSITEEDRGMNCLFFFMA